jgi:retron-type reverse transcriptase
LALQDGLGARRDGRRRAGQARPQRALTSSSRLASYLHRLDRQWTKRGTGVLARYADDLVVLCHSKREAEAALVSLRSILAELGLELKQAKTRIVHLREGGRG